MKKADSLLDFLLYKPMKKWGENHTISIYQDKLYTYADYEKNVNKTARFLGKIGIQKETLVIYMDDCPACIVAFLGAIAIGAKPLIITPKTKSKVLGRIERISHSRILIKEPETNVDTNSIIVNLNYYEEECFFECIGELDEEVSVIEGDVCYLAMTSGSSGIPKIVKHSAQEMQAATYYYASKVLEINENDTLLSIPKINFTYGLANSLFFSFALGARAILYQGRLENIDIISLILKYGVSCFFAVPSVFSKLLNDITKGQTDKIRLFISAGEYLSGDLNHKWYMITEKYIVDSVGCSETGSAYLVNFNYKDKAGSAGLPVSGYELELCGGDERQGMLVVSGPSNAIGYLNDSKNTEKKFIGGKVYTGDWFVRDDDGYYWFQGRIDDMIKKNGHWVSLNEISNFIRSQRGVLSVACFQCQSRIYAIVESKEEFEGIDHLRTMIMNNLEHYKCPDIIMNDFIPHNVNGKIDYQLLRGKYGKRKYINGKI